MYDFIARTLLKIINEYNLNNKYLWITYNIYIKHHKDIINEKNENILNTENNIISLIQSINDLNMGDAKNEINEISHNELNNDISSDKINNSNDSSINSDENDNNELNNVEELEDDILKNLIENANDTDNLCIKINLWNLKINFSN